MAHKTIFNLEIGIIETKLEGVIAFSELKEVISELTIISQTEQCYFWLNDFSEANPQFSVTEIYEFPKLIVEAATSLNIEASQIKRAVVMSTGEADYPFAKTIALNRGQSLELFDDIEKARTWLKN